MIRLTFLLRRQPSFTRAAFQHTWLTAHGPKVARVARDLRIQRYVQVHTLDDPANDAMAQARGGMEPVFDGVAELWWSHRDDLAAALETDAGQAAGAMLVEDEATFIDLPNSPLWLAHEYPQVNPVPENILARPRNRIVKLHYPLRHVAALSRVDAQLDWHVNHGPLIRSQADASGILRYVQVHRVEDPLEAALRQARGTLAEPFTGHAELWFDRNALAGDAPEARAAGRRAIEDEARFIDFQRSSIFLAKEHVLIDHRQE